MKYVQAIMENAELQESVSSAMPVLEESIKSDISEWYKTMYTFVTEHIEDFLGGSLEETATNIYTFSAFASQQYLSEMSALYGDAIEESEAMKDAAKREFF